MVEVIAKLQEAMQKAAAEAVKEEGQGAAGKEAAEAPAEEGAEATAEEGAEATAEEVAEVPAEEKSVVEPAADAPEPSNAAAGNSFHISFQNSQCLRVWPACSV